MRAKLAVGMAALAVACTPRDSLLVCRVEIPPAYRGSAVAGEPEADRYRQAYEAFWWNCVALKAGDLDARCPLVCNGTPAASAGCADGSTTADDGIRRHLEQYGRSRTESDLRSLSRNDEVQ